jgi:hypothetical protein
MKNSDYIFTQKTCHDAMMYVVAVLSDFVLYSIVAYLNFYLIVVVWGILFELSYNC